MPKPNLKKAKEAASYAVNQLTETFAAEMYILRQAEVAQDLKSYNEALGRLSNRKGFAEPRKIIHHILEENGFGSSIHIVEYSEFVEPAYRAAKALVSQKYAKQENAPSHLPEDHKDKSAAAIASGETPSKAAVGLKK